MFLRNTFLCASFCASSLLAISNSTHAQTLITFKECVDATALSTKYSEARRELVNEQRNSGEMSAEQRDQVTQEISDFQTTYTIDHCMQRVDSRVYFCLLKQQGNFSNCRS